MASFSAKRHTWDYPESVDHTDFSNSRFEYITTHALHANNADAIGIMVLGASNYVIDNTDNLAYHYDSDWVYVETKTLNANNTDPHCIAYTGTYIQITDNVDGLVYQYGVTWLEDGTHALHANNTDPLGVWGAVNSVHYVLDGTDKLIYEYNAAWAYVATHALHANNADAIGMDWYGSYWFVVDRTDNMVYIYDSNWTYVRTHALHANNTDALGISSYEGYLYIIDGTDNMIYKYDSNISCRDVGGHKDAIIIYDEMYETWAAAHTTGNVEFWLYAKDAADKVEIVLEDGSGNHCINISIDNDKIIGDGSDALDPALDFIYYRIRIDFDCTPNTYDLYIDGTKELTGEAFGVNDDGSGLTKLSTNVDTDENGLIDGIGYDWDADYDVGDNADDTVAITDDISYCKIVEEIGTLSYADMQIKMASLTDFEGGHEVDFYDSDAVLSWSGIILYPESVIEGAAFVGNLKMVGLDSKFDNIYRKNFTTVRDSEYILKHIIDNYLTKHHSYDNEIDDFTITYKYDLKSKILKFFKYQSMLERAIIHYKPDGEIIFNKYDNLTATGKSWDQDTTKIRIKNYTPNANRHITRAPVIGANNDLGQVYYVGTATEDEEDEFGINELQPWRDPEITNYTETKQLGDNLQTIYSTNTQMISMIVSSKKHVQVGYTIELAWSGAYTITKDDFLVTRRIWYPINDMCDLELTDNILTRKAFNIQVVQKEYDEDAQQSYEEPDVPESTTDGTVESLHSVAELRSPTYLDNEINEQITIHTAITHAHESISDIAYNEASWNANVDGASKNAIRDQIEVLISDYRAANLIGAGNAQYVAATLYSWWPASPAFNCGGYGVRNIGATDFFLTYYLDLPTTFTGKKLYCTGMGVGIKVADNDDYLTQQLLLGFNSTGTTTLQTTNTDRVTAGDYLSTFSATDLSSYKMGGMFLHVISTTANQFNLYTVYFRVYYS